MLVSIKQQIFNSSDPAALVWACIEPTVQQVRGKNLTVKSEVFAELTPGQRALFMFQVLYGHARDGVVQFYGYVAYLQPNFDLWSGLKGGMRYFGDDAMLRLIEEMERTYRLLKNRQEGEECIFANNLDNDPELLTSVGQIDAIFRETIPATLKRIGAYIRNHPDEFVRLEE